MLSTSSRPLAIKFCLIGTAGSVRIMALKKRTKKHVCSLIHKSLQKFNVQSFMLSSLCLLLNWDMLHQRIPCSLTFPMLTSVLTSGWYRLKWDLVEDKFQKEKIKILYSSYATFLS